MNKRRPQAHEYGAFYQGYINKVKTDDLMKALTEGKGHAADFFKSLPKEKWDYKYAPGKWTIKEVLQHLIDGERVFAYRSLRIARNDETPLPGFNENLFANNSHAGSRSPDLLIEEYKSVRSATLHLFKSFGDEDLSRIGTASGNPASPLAIGFIIAGHELHHIDVLQERYLDQ